MLSKDWESFEKSDIAWWRVINICRDSLSVFFALPIGIAHHRTYIQWRLCRLPLADLLLYNRSCCISMDVSVQLVGASCRASRRTESLMKQKLPWIHCVVWHIVYTFITISTKYWPKNKSKCAAEVDTTAVSQSFVLIWVEPYKQFVVRLSLWKNKYDNKPCLKGAKVWSL